MKRSLFAHIAVTVVLTFLAWLPSQVQAGYIASILTNNVDNTFEDQSREAYVDVNNNTVFDKGDVLLGFVRIDNKSPGAVSVANQIYGIFSQQVDNVTANGSHFDIDFKPTTVAGLKLSDIVPVASPNAMLAAFDKIGAFPVDLIANSPGDLTGNGTVNIFDYFKSIKDNGHLELIGGFGTGATEADDYLQASTQGFGDFLPLPGGTILIPAIPSSAQVGSYLGGMSILFNDSAPAITYDEVVLSAHTASGGLGGPLITTHQLVVNGGSILGEVGFDHRLEWDNINPDSVLTNPGGFGDKADFIVHPNIATAVPEPNTILLLGSGLAAFAALSYGRLRKKS